MVIIWGKSVLAPLIRLNWSKTDGLEYRHQCKRITSWVIKRVKSQ